MHVITGLGTGGAEMMLYKLVSGSTKGIEHSVVSVGDQGSMGARISAQSIPVHGLGIRPATPNPLGFLALRRLTQKIRPQLIQGWMPHGNLMATIAGILSRDQPAVLWNVRMSLSSVHREPWLTDLAIKVGARCSGRAAAIIYNSRSGARQHEAIGYDASKTVFLPNGFDCDVFHPDPETRKRVREELGIGDDDVLIGLVARFHPMKDHEGFLRAAALVSKVHSGVRVALIGTGTKDEALKSLARKYGMEDQVLLLGERSDTPRFTVALDIACSASAWGEGFSNSIGEAMACGVPCVVTDIGDSGFIVGDTGLTVPASDPGAVAKALSQLIQAGPEHRQRLGLAARRRIENEFSLSAIVRQYEDLYLSMIKNAVTRLPSI